MKHTTLYNDDGTPKDGVNILALRKLSDTLHNPTVLPDFEFDMKRRETCILGFGVGCNILPESFLNGAQLDEEGYLPNIKEIWWLCHVLWEKVDNTREGAALRIDYLLDTGLPEDWRDQMNGKSPLCYRK